MPHLSHPGCGRHDRSDWWRLRAGGTRTVAGLAGIWRCSICHAPPEPLLPEIERWDVTVHEDEWAQALVEERGLPAVSPTHIVGQTTASTLNVTKATELFSKWRGEEFGWVKARIVTLARIHGEYHADMMIGVTLSQPNMIGAAVNALARSGYLEKLNREGDVEHRQTRSGTSRRASYVWRLSADGRALSAHLRKALGNTDRLPGPPATGSIHGTVSKDGTTIQGALE